MNIQNIGSVIRFQILSCGQYDQQSRTAYQGQSAADFLSRVEKATHGFTNSDQHAFAEVAYDATLANGRVEDAYVSYGWDAPRMRWFLETHHTSVDGRVLATILSGYTEQPDVEHGGVVNDNARFYINNIAQYTLNQLTAVKSYTGKILAGVSDTTNTCYQTPDRVANDFPVVGNQALESFTRSVNNDYRDCTDKSYGVQMASTENFSPSHYMSRLVRGTVTATRSVAHQNMEGKGYSDDFNDLSDTGIGHVTQRMQTSRERDVQHVPLVHALSLNSGQLLQNGSFTFFELKSVYPTIDTLTRVDYYRMDSNERIIRPGTFATLDDSPTADVARELNALIPTIMSNESVAISVIDIASDQANNVTVKAFRPLFSYLDNDENYYQFSEELRQSIFSSINSLSARYGTVQVTIETDMNGDTIYHVRLNYTGTVSYCVPQFMDGTLSPVVSSEFISRLHTAAMTMEIAEKFYQTNYAAKYNQQSPLLDSEYFRLRNTELDYYNGQPVYSGVATQDRNPYQQPPVQINPYAMQGNAPAYPSTQQVVQQNPYPSPEQVKINPTQQSAQPEPNQVDDTNVNFKW